MTPSPGAGEECCAVLPTSWDTSHRPTEAMGHSLPACSAHADLKPTHCVDQERSSQTGRRAQKADRQNVDDIHSEKTPPRDSKPRPLIPLQAFLCKETPPHQWVTAGLRGLCFYQMFLFWKRGSPLLLPANYLQQAYPLNVTLDEILQPESPFTCSMKYATISSYFRKQLLG